MKKILCLILALVMCFSLCACGLGRRWASDDSYEYEETIESLDDWGGEIDSSFVGTYIHYKSDWIDLSPGDHVSYIYIDSIITLNEDGTGTREEVISAENRSSILPTNVQVEELVSLYTFEWRVRNGELRMDIYRAVEHYDPQTEELGLDYGDENCYWTEFATITDTEIVPARNSYDVHTKIS